MEKNTGSIKKATLLYNLKIILTKNLGIKPKESLLIVHDKKYEKLAKKFLKIRKASLLKIPNMKINGEEPPKNIAKKFLDYDVIIFLTSKSLSHTKARRDATKKGARIASMPGITEPIIKRSIDIDYNKLQKDSLKYGKILDKANKITISTKLGTNLSFSIKGRKAHGLKAGIYNKKSYWGNLPEGEVFIAPVEGTANGKFIVDGSIAGFGKVKKTIFEVKNGFVTAIAGNKSEEIAKLLSKVGKNSRNIAEFGIGLNRKAKITGIVLEDEKVYGTCHIALGNNIGFGGKVNVPLHIDCVIRNPDILFH